MPGGVGHSPLAARLNPKAWYSPSGSFLQIVPLRDGAGTLICGAQARFTVEYTTSIASNATVMYKVGFGLIRSCKANAFYALKLAFCNAFYR